MFSNEKQKINTENSQGWNLWQVFIFINKYIVSTNYVLEFVKFSHYRDK